MNENIAEAMRIPMWAFLQIFISEVCIIDLKSSSSPKAAKPAIINRLSMRPPMVSTLTNFSIISVADSCICFIKYSNLLIESGSVKLAFHSEMMLLKGMMAKIIAVPIRSHKMLDSFNPNALTGSFFTKNAYAIGGNTKVKSWLLICINLSEFKSCGLLLVMKTYAKPITVPKIKPIIISANSMNNLSNFVVFLMIGCCIDDEIYLQI